MDDEMTPEELHRRLAGGSAPVLLDVRQGWETRLCALAHATHIPMEEMEARVDELDPEPETVVYCHLGIRSAAVVAYLRQCGFRDVKNLAGGLDAWARVVDPSMRRY